VSAIYITACTNGSTTLSNASNSESALANVSISEGNTSSNTAPEAPTSTQANIATNTPTGTVEDTLKKLFSERTAVYTADYTITDNESTQEMTQAFDKPRYATITNTTAGVGKAIFDGTEMIACSTEGGAWQCFKVPMQEPTSAQIESKLNDTGTTTTIIGTCSVAGETGTNYEVTAQDGSITQVCYTNDGIMLEVKTTKPESSIVATRIVRSVDSTIFTPPVQPQDLSSIMQNITQR